MAAKAKTGPGGKHEAKASVPKQKAGKLKTALQKATPAAKKSANDGPVEAFEDHDVSDAVVILAFPSAGSASSIAAQYLVRHLTLPLVGHFVRPALQGLVAVQDGRVTAPIRVYGGEVQCRIGKDCPKVFLVTSELALPPNALPPVAASVGKWAKDGGAHMLLVLDAVGRLPGDDVPDVFAASANPEVLEALQEAGIEPMRRALLAGMTALVLHEAPAQGLGAGAILVEANNDQPDGRAAAALVEAVAKLIPDVIVDAEPLMKEAMELEREIDKARRQANLTVSTPPGTFV